MPIDTGSLLHCDDYCDNITRMDGKLLTAQERLDMATAALHSVEAEHYRLSVSQADHPSLEAYEERVKRLQDEVASLEGKVDAE